MIEGCHLLNQNQNYMVHRKDDHKWGKKTNQVNISSTKSPYLYFFTLYEDIN